MISFLRERLQGIVAFSFLGIVALTFAFLGLHTFTQTFSKNNYATIGEYEISQSEYISTRNQVESTLRDQFGQSVDLSNPILFDAVEELTKNSLIERYTIIKLFDELGIDVPENYIENELSKVESFQVDGKFDQEAFKNYLINFNLSKNELMRSFSNDFKINFSVNLLSSMINSFDKDIDEYLKLVTEKRDLIFVNLTSENVANDFEISEDDLISYYSENPNLFLVPEKRSFYEINLSSKNFDFDISEEEFAAGYASGQLSIEDFGSELDLSNLNQYLIPLTEATDSEIKGEILWVDHYGNCQTNVSPEELRELKKSIGDVINIKIGNAEIKTTWVDSYQGEYLGEVGLITDSWGMVSLFATNKNASSILNIKDGAKINFSI